MALALGLCPSLAIHGPWFARSPGGHSHLWLLWPSVALALSDVAYLLLAGGDGAGVFVNQLLFLGDLG